MTLGSLFTGIGGFDYGFELAGFETIWQVEKEPFCIAVLKKHFPNVERYYEIKDCGIGKKHKLKFVDIICAGVPCQDVSVAGKRAGLAGERTGLFYEFARILCEVRPAWFVFENVPGLLSSNGGRDFAEILRVLMVKCGYGVCWRVLDSQFFGVAQRRRRVFVVGSFGKPCPAEVLFESQSGEGNFTESAKERPELALDIAASLRGIGGKPRGFNLDAEQGLAVTYEDAGRMRGRREGAIDFREYEFDAGKRQRSGTAIAFAQNQRGELRTSRISPQLTTGGGKPGEGYPAVAMSTGHSSWRGEDRDTYIPECSPADTNGVRDFASLPEGLDSARYRALGNAVTAKVAQWIAERIKAVNFIPA